MKPNAVKDWPINYCRIQSGVSFQLAVHNARKLEAYATYCSAAAKSFNRKPEERRRAVKRFRNTAREHDRSTHEASGLAPGVCPYNAASAKLAASADGSGEFIPAACRTPSMQPLTGLLLESQRLQLAHAIAHVAAGVPNLWIDQSFDQHDVAGLKLIQPGVVNKCDVAAEAIGRIRVVVV